MEHSPPLTIYPTIAFTGNPNVGKSTLFNQLTGLHQHTGNWTGKTVSTAMGRCTVPEGTFSLVDLPGTYSLYPQSAEEGVARDFLAFGNHSGVVVVCDATCLSRNLPLVLEIMALCPHVLVCVNLMDEATTKGYTLDLDQLSTLLGVPVVGTQAREMAGVAPLIQGLPTLSTTSPPPTLVTYHPAVEESLDILVPLLSPLCRHRLPPRWVALQLLREDIPLLEEVEGILHVPLLSLPHITAAWGTCRDLLFPYNLVGPPLQEHITTAHIATAQTLAEAVVTSPPYQPKSLDRKIDRVVTGRWTAYPMMLTLLIAIFWMTITGANYPSQLLSNGFTWMEVQLTAFFTYLSAPPWLHGILVEGMFRTVTWVVAVMLPPMAIFFPLFTLLEDGGYLPRVAYNLDKPFQRCSACGKQALCMSMGFGCNVVGVMGARIIQSPRERMLAILTNVFVPCNGRFPTIILMITLFFVGTDGGWLPSLLSAILLTGVIIFGVIVTFGVTKLLSLTLLRGLPSSFTLELPPYRKPKVGAVIVRSVLDRTLFVLGRAIVVAAPAGLIIWVLANLTLGDASILTHCAQWLEPFAQILGLDGVILLAFLLGCPANEIVLPIMVMLYLSQGSLLEMDNIWEMKTLLTDNGWTVATAVSVTLFSLMHWPCTTVLLTIKKETGSLKWTVLAALIPTLCGVLCCAGFTMIWNLLH